MTSVSRRVRFTFVAALTGALLPSAVPAASALSASATKAPAAPKELQARIAELGRTFDGSVGIAVHSIDEGWSAGWNADVLCPQQSVSKLWVSISVLDAVDKGRLSLQQPVTLTRDDLTLFHQPIAEQILAGPYTTTVGDLLFRAITTSDNTANDKLMWLIGGPGSVRAMIKAKDLGPIRFADGERSLQSRIAGLAWDPAYSIGNAFYEARDALPEASRKLAFDRYVADPYDGAAPSAVVAALTRLKRGELLSPASTQYLLQTMSMTHTGPNRLKGGLAPGWLLNHKTGTGQVFGVAQAGYNDVGILTGPDGRSYAVAVMIKLTSVPLPVRMTLMNDVVRSVIAQHDIPKDSSPR